MYLSLTRCHNTPLNILIRKIQQQLARDYTSIIDEDCWISNLESLCFSTQVYTLTSSHYLFLDSLDDSLERFSVGEVALIKVHVFI